MRAWELGDAWGIDHMAQVDRAEPVPGPGQVAIRMRAAAINYRDLVVVTNKTPFGKLPQIPLSDGAGEVVALGEGVTRFAIGDRVCPNFFPDWIEGPPLPAAIARSLGSASAPGVLQEMVVADEQGVSHAPANLSWAEAATLPCAALTAWRALVVEGNVQAGETVLVQGTGGVSIFALQFAKMLGATVIATSSSDAKLERVRALGADHLVNYRTTPEWSTAALAATGGRGVDHIVEVGGAGTINQSLAAAAMNGKIAIVGVLGGRSQELLMPAIFGKNLHLNGVSIGSRTHFEAMARAIEAHDLHPVVDRTFGFDAAPEALRTMEQGAHFGKIVIEFDA